MSDTAAIVESRVRVEGLERNADRIARKLDELDTSVQRLTIEVTTQRVRYDVITGAVGLLSGIVGAFAAILASRYFGG